jgi:transposase
MTRTDQADRRVKSTFTTIIIDVNVERETNIEMLRTKARLALLENKRLVDEIVRVKRENLQLKGAAPDQLQQEMELLDAQLRKDAEALEERARDVERGGTGGAKPDEPKAGRKKREHFGTREGQKTLPITSTAVHALDEADKQCGECGGELKEWEGHDDETEEVVVVERRFEITKHIRKKYRCACGCIEQPLMPPRLLAGGRYSNGFAVLVAAMKYVDQLPLERIVRIFGREGLVIDSQTLWSIVLALATKLKPAWRRLREEILKSTIVGVDQSPWPVLGHEKKKWQMWTLSTATLAYFDIKKSKGLDDGKRVLGDFKGIVFGDAATTHDSLQNELPITLAHCWAHPRRDAEKLLASDPMRAQVIIDFIRELYDADDEARDDIEKRRFLRDTRSREVLRRLHEWRIDQRPLPSSPTAKLLGYLENHKEGLERFLEDPLIPLDNNQCERGYVWVAVGRRSFFGSRSELGTQVAAILYSFAETARRNGVDPKAYFAAALEDALAGATIRLPHEMS